MLRVAQGAGILSDKSDSDISDQNLHSIGIATTLGFGIAISLAVLVGGGVWLDIRFNTAPWLTIIGLALGLVAAGYQLYELVLVSQKDRKPGPIGAKLANRQKGKSR